MPFKKLKENLVHKETVEFIKYCFESVLKFHSNHLLIIMMPFLDNFLKMLSFL